MVSGSKTEEKLINTPATMSVITAQMIENGADTELCRTVALGAWPEHHAGLCA